MSESQAYEEWLAAGRPWKPAPVIARLQAWAVQRGIPVLGTIANYAHLTAIPPEDHTPFSATGRPLPSPRWIVTAIDLAEERNLGDGILREARAGRASFLKYINVNQLHYDYSDGFRASRYNSDTHNHLSVRTDMLDAVLGDFDPLGEGTNDMGAYDEDRVHHYAAFGRLLAISANTPTVEWVPSGVAGERNELHFKLEEILAAVKAIKPVTLTQEQIDQLGQAISDGVLDPMASAAEAAASVLRDAAGE